MAAPDFVLQPLRAISVGAGVRHFENGRHPAQHSGAAARCEVFLMLKARLAEMHLTVDDARQNIQTRAVNHFTRIAKAIAQRCDLFPPTADADLPCSARRMHSSIFADVVEGL